MSQFQWQTIDPNTTSGTALANLLNQGEAALHSQHIGPNRPSYVVPGMIWIDNTDPLLWELNVFDGVGDAQIGTVNTFTSKFSAVVDAAFVTFNPASSSLTAVNVQAAIDELDSKKGNLTGMIMTGNISMGGNLISDLGAPTGVNQAARKVYVDDADNLRLARTGGTMSGGIAMGDNRISGMAAPINNKDAANKAYVDAGGAGDGNNSQNGWRDIGPIRLQWGRTVTTGVGPTTIPFSVNFSGNAWSVQVTNYASVASFTNAVAWSITNSDFTVRTDNNVNQVNWFAVGLA